MMSRAQYLKIWEQTVPGAQHTAKGSHSPDTEHAWQVQGQVRRLQHLESSESGENSVSQRQRGGRAKLFYCHVGCGEDLALILSSFSSLWRTFSGRDTWSDLSI